MAEVYFLSEVKKNMMVWKIRDLVTKAGQVITSHLLFLHAWTVAMQPQQHSGMGKPAC